MRREMLSVAVLVILFASISMTAIANEGIANGGIANEGIEYFIKSSSDLQTLYLQDTYTDPGPNNVNIVLINTSQLDGHATNQLDDATILYDEENSIYKMWVVAWQGPGNYWSVYYAESDSLLNWNAKNIRECFYGWDTSRQRSTSVLKESDSSYKMWSSVYHHDGWKEQIWYRSSTDGITWTKPQLVISAVPLDDWRFPTALHLKCGNDRLYYDHIYRDVYDFIYLYRADVAMNGISTFNKTQFARIIGAAGILGASIMGDQCGGNHHRVWATTGIPELLRYDSFDEGQSWTATKMGIYNTTNYAIVGTFYEVESMIPATIDIDPDTLNQRSKGQWISAYIELPEGYSAKDINVSTIMLNNTFPAELRPTSIQDHDSDTIPDLMVKFNRAQVISYILSNINMKKRSMTITLTITGKLKDSTPFQGSKTIRIIG